MAPPQKKKKDGKAFVAGAFAGAIDTCFTMPLDTLKTQMQINKTPMMQTLRTTVRANGFMGLYAGFPAFCLQASGKSAVRFFTYSLLSPLFPFESYPTASALTCGLLAGATEATIWTSPSERIKVMQQAASAKSGAQASSLSVLRNLLQTQGVKGLYVGVVPTAARQSSSVAVRFMLYERIKKTFAESKTLSVLPSSAVSFLAGGTGGAVSVILNNPIDIIKSKVQSGASSGGTMQVIRETFRERGVGVFMDRSLQVRVPRLFISQAIQFSVVDFVLSQWV